MKTFISYTTNVAGIALCSVLLFFACSKSKDPLDESKYKTDIYLGGKYEEQAAYWKNGEKFMLEQTSGSNYSYVTSIFVYNGDVHIIGAEYVGSSYYSRYWKNGKITPFDNGTNDNVYARSVFVSNGDVYIAGSSKNGTKDIATFWKNGVPTQLSPSEEGYAHSILAYGSDIYVSGGTYNYDNKGKSVVTYWKSGTPIILSDGVHNAYTYSMAVSGNDVYVAGREGTNTYDQAIYWKNGEKVLLTDGTSDDAEAYSISVQSGVVYVSVLDYTEGEGFKYWKNDVVTKLEDNYAEGSSLFVLDGDVYMTGSVQNGDNIRAAYWKNGKQVLLTDGSESYSESYAVFVDKGLE